MKCSISIIYTWLWIVVSVGIFSIVMHSGNISLLLPFISTIICMVSTLISIKVKWIRKLSFILHLISQIFIYIICGTEQIWNFDVPNRHLLLYIIVLYFLGSIVSIMLHFRVLSRTITPINVEKINVFTYLSLHKCDNRCLMQCLDVLTNICSTSL